MVIAYDRTTIGLYPKDNEIISTTIRAAGDLGYRLNATQAIRVLIRKGEGVTVTKADCEAALAEDPRRNRKKG